MAANIVIHYSRVWEEYRVPHPKGTEAAAYYTNDRHDALDTAGIMWDGVDYEQVVIKRVNEYPKYLTAR